MLVRLEEKNYRLCSLSKIWAVVFAICLGSNLLRADPIACAAHYADTLERPTVQVIRSSTGVNITNSGLASNLLVEPVWIRFLDKLKITKLNFVNKLVNRTRANFKTLGFDELPDYKGIVEKGLTAESFDPDVYLSFQKSKPEYERLLRHHDKISRQMYGDVILTDVFLNPYSAQRSYGNGKVNAYLDTPALLGQLKNGQPVMVVLMSPRSIKEDLEIPTVKNRHDNIIQNALVASTLGIGGQLYGVQILSDYVAGLIIELPPRGAPLQFGGAKNFSIESFKQIISIVDKLVSSGADVPGLGFDLRPYVTSNGNIQLYPTGLASRITFNEGNLEFRNIGQVTTLVRYLRELSPNNLDQIYNWLIVNRLPIYRALVRHAPEALTYERELVEKNLPRDESVWRWARELQMHAEKSRGQPLGPIGK